MRSTALALLSACRPYLSSLLGIHHYMLLCTGVLYFKWSWAIRRIGKVDWQLHRLAWRVRLSVSPATPSRKIDVRRFQLPWAWASSHTQDAFFRYLEEGLYMYIDACAVRMHGKAPLLHCIVSVYLYQTIPCYSTCIETFLCSTTTVNICMYICFALHWCL